jgi:hypothetical protein
MLRPLVAHRADQPRMACAVQRENRQEVGFIEIDVQLAIEGGPRSIYVGDIKHLLIGAAGEAGARAMSRIRRMSSTKSGAEGQLEEM